MTELHNPDSLTRGVRIGVGSMNIHKNLAVLMASVTVLGPSWVKPYDAESGVRTQPFGKAETMAGASHRADSTMRATQPHIAVGVESGLIKKADRLYTVAGIMVVGRSGIHAEGWTNQIVVPEAVGRLVLDGLEMKEAVAREYGADAVKGGDCIFPITDGKITAPEFFAVGVFAAMAEYRDKIIG